MKFVKKEFDGYIYFINIDFDKVNNVVVENISGFDSDNYLDYLNNDLEFELFNEEKNKIVELNNNLDEGKVPFDIPTFSKNGNLSIQESIDKLNETLNKMDDRAKYIPYKNIIPEIISDLENT